MKLFVINVENSNEKVEIEIDQNSYVKTIMMKMDEILKGNGHFTRIYYRLFAKSMILFDGYYMSYYKLYNHDEVWFGKVENYLKSDEVIVEIFVIGHTPTWMWLIVKQSDSISTIKAIIEQIRPGIIDIWNVIGQQMMNDQSVTDIASNGDFRLIISFDNGKELDSGYSFERCLDVHDQCWLERYLFLDKIRDDNKFIPIRLALVNHLKEIISTNQLKDARLNKNLADFPSALVNSKFLFCEDVTYRIWYIFIGYWAVLENQYENRVTNVFVQYFNEAIHAALWRYANLRQVHGICLDKAIAMIIMDALEYFEKYLSNPNNNWRFWMKLWLNQFLLRPLLTDYVLDKAIDKCDVIKTSVNIRINGEDYEMFIQKIPQTIFQAKRAISIRYGVNILQLHCIKSEADNKPDDQDPFNQECLIEIALNMAEIEIVKLLGCGGFGAVYLCRDKISHKSFVLKKANRVGGNLYRDIFIQSKLQSPKNLMNYSKLFRDEEGIHLAIDYMPGGSLNLYIEKNPHLSESEILKISYQVLLQINELHGFGIIHRDIKSDNIVLDECNNAKLIDFGVSKYTAGLTTENLLENPKAYTPGTVYYMAPELIKGELYSNKIDIWSFGMVMVEMTTGKIPFHWLLPLQAMMKISQCQKYEFKPDAPISDQFKQFIDLCLTVDQFQRPLAKQLINSQFISDYLNELRS